MSRYAYQQENQFGKVKVVAQGNQELAKALPPLDEIPDLEKL